MDPVLATACQQLVAAQPGAAGALSKELAATAAAVTTPAKIPAAVSSLTALAAALKS